MVTGFVISTVFIHITFSHCIKAPMRHKELISQLYPLELPHLQNHRLVLAAGHCYLPAVRKPAKVKAARLMPQRSLSDQKLDWTQQRHSRESSAPPGPPWAAAPGRGVRNTDSSPRSFQARLLRCAAPRSSLPGVLTPDQVRHFWQDGPEAE